MNDTQQIQAKNQLTTEPCCIVPSLDDDTELHIPMKLDGVFSYFQTCALTHEEIENCEDMQAMNLTPDAVQWNPYDEDFAVTEGRYLDFRGDLVNRPATR